MNAQTYRFKGKTIDIAAMSAAELLPIFNDCRAALKMESIGRFSDSKTARRRTAEIFEQVGIKLVTASAEVEKAAPAPAPVVEDEKPVAQKPARAPREPKAAPTPREPRGTNLQPPGHAPIPCREGSKQALLVDLLSKPAGATMNELLAGLSGGNKPWTEASVRGGFGWDMKQKGYGVHSVFDEHGTERFHLVLPTIKGTVASIPGHTPLKGKPKHDARQSRLTG